MELVAAEVDGGGSLLPWAAPDRRLACLQVLSSATADELNYMLLHTNCPALVEVADGAIMQLLTSPRSRLYELSVMARYGAILGPHAGV